MTAVPSDEANLALRGILCCLDRYLKDANIGAHSSTKIIISPANLKLALRLISLLACWRKLVEIQQSQLSSSPQ